MNTTMMFQDQIDHSRFLNPIQEKLELRKVTDPRTGRTRPETVVMMVCRVLFARNVGKKGKVNFGKLDFVGTVAIPQKLFTWEDANVPEYVERIGFKRVK